MTTVKPGQVFTGVSLSGLVIVDATEPVPEGFLGEWLETALIPRLQPRTCVQFRWSTDKEVRP